MGNAAKAFCARREEAIVFAALALAIIWRAWWVHTPGRLATIPSEVRNAAVAFAKTGVIADAYGPGQGPTAHVTPVMALYEGVVYRLLGEGAAAEWVLAGVAIGLVAASAGLLYLCMKRLGAPTEWRLAGLLVVCLLPFNAWLELRDLRYFEGVGAVVVGAALLLRVLQLDDKPTLSLRDAAGIGLGVAFLAMLNPATALGVYGAIGVLILRRSPWRRWPAIAAIMVATLVVVLAPWGLRNERAMGHLILTRSNFGLELAQAYHPGAVDPPDLRAAFIARHEAIHPLANPAAFENLKAVGELEYSDALGREARAWIAQNPADAAKIALRSFRQFWLPDPWMYSAWSPQVSTKDLVKTGFVWATTLLAFAAVAAGLISREAKYLYILPALLLPSLPYVMVQPVIRYRYLISSLVIFLACDALRRLAQYLASRRSKPLTAPA